MKVLDFTQFKDLKDLQEYANKQFGTIAFLDNRIKELEAKNSHLESLLKNKATVVSVGSQQEEICNIEINRLYQKTLREPLEFQEVKILESLTKILMLSQGKSVDDKDMKKLNKAMKDLSPQDLINIALQKTPEDESN